MKLLRLPLIGLPLLVFAGMVIAGCASRSTEPPTSAGNPQDTNAQQGGPVAPGFIVRTGAGSAFSLAEHKGEVVVLYFSFPG